MKRQQLRELREASEDELNKKLEDSRSLLYEMRVKSKTGQMEKTADIKNTKKQIARILTEISARTKVQNKS